MGLRDETDFSRILADSELVFAGAGEPEDLEAERRSKAYRRLRTELAKMRVPLASAAKDSAIQMIAAELDMVRSHRAGA